MGRESARPVDSAILGGVVREVERLEREVERLEHEVETLRERLAQPSLSTSQVAQALGVSLGTIRRWTDDAALDSYRTPGGQRRFSRDQVDAFLATRLLPAKHRP